jgi:hypothetical protein
LNDWKQSLKGNRGSCSDEIRDFLDLHMPGWRHTSRAKSSVSSISSGDSDDDTFLVEKEKSDTGRAISASSTHIFQDNIEKEVCHAMMSKFSTTTQQLSHLWSLKHPVPCSDKRISAVKRKRAFEEEMDEEVAKQIRIDSELLLLLSGSQHRFQNVVS